jgi:hypothetical protein
VNDIETRRILHLKNIVVNRCNRSNTVWALGKNGIEGYKILSENNWSNEIKELIGVLDIE